MRTSDAAISSLLISIHAGLCGGVIVGLVGMTIGGGLGTRLGAPYAKRIAEAMQPHLFVDSRPPVVEVAGLGDLGGALGAALLVKTPRR